jgi:hypothetical protein
MEALGARPRATRQLAGWGLAFAWALSGLMQLIAPACLHHARAAAPRAGAPRAGAPHAGALVASDAHTAHAHEAPAHTASVQAAHPHAAPGDALPPSHHGTDPMPCDCLGDCLACAVAVFDRAMLDTPGADLGTRRAAPAAPDTRRVHDARRHRQPPATAPPHGTRTLA